jgi:hypothetical protein
MRGRMLRRRYDVVDLVLMMRLRGSGHALRTLLLQVRLSIGFYLAISSALSLTVKVDLQLGWPSPAAQRLYH